MKKYYCVDCKKPIKKEHKRCWKCYVEWSQIPANNPMFGIHLFKNGISSMEYYCVDCQIKINSHTFLYGGKRCRHCARIYQYKIKPDSNPAKGKTGERSPLFIKDKPVCSCGKTLIGFKAKQCQKCYLKTLNWKGNPNYIHGESEVFYPSEFNSELKTKIRNKYGYACLLCGGKGICVHHIDYDKDNSKENNLITLCCKCHSKTNFNRDYWFAYFAYIMENL